MVSILFWNTNQIDNSEQIGNICLEKDIDILLLAECKIDSDILLNRMNSLQPERNYVEYIYGESAVRFISRFPASMIIPEFDNGRVSVRRFKPPIGREISIVAVHLPSQLHTDELERYAYTRSVRSEIEAIEERIQHRNTIIIGDLNMDPFDMPLTAADGFHAMMDKKIAQKPHRVAMGTKYSFFYNPMWSRLGDTSAGPVGTYYYSKGGAINNRYWHLFDQILLRPDLLDFFDDKDLEVISNINGVSLIQRNKIDKNISDHLPIMLNLTIEREM